ncbi:hypothetical protein T4B_15146 [Trichinella pseudospiralis]|uniref:Uncharacterized protein n=1 Tax=Trichinella pseudospiralis TaxID=6337 RepID=A0A0V1ICN7_TRIPS|nr:hypothetical protein T4B_15146 [Trichinella pseudospiralis]
MVWTVLFLGRGCLMYLYCFRSARLEGRLKHPLCEENKQGAVAVAFLIAGTSFATLAVSFNLPQRDGACSFSIGHLRACRLWMCVLLLIFGMN